MGVWIENIFKFAKRWYYRIIAEDEDGYSTYIDFNVWNPDGSPLDGFTQKEFEMIERIFNVWPTLMSKLRSEYPKLKNNTASLFKNHVEFDLQSFAISISLIGNLVIYTTQIRTFELIHSTSQQSRIVRY